jgi:hypothetical protein
MCCAHSAGERVGTRGAVFRSSTEVSGCACHSGGICRMLIERHTTDLVLGVADPVVAIHEGFFAF